MSGDYTRFTFDPADNYSGVRMQQGRVTLDADFNELVDIVERRWRTETVDIIGRCIVPSETPDGFRIDLAGGTMTVGRGRAYVDGLLAENHGAPPLEFDRTLEETRGTQPVRYEEQPYLPEPEPLPKQGGPHLVYLDVWKREVTFTEDPDLVEKAVGVDTAARTQTVWQVRVFSGEDRERPISCETPDDDIPGWAEHTAPSAGRLTTAAVGVPTPDDPCIVPPAGGYRGTENRLYRVEIHDAGGAGTATFKWSRDNASWATTVTALNAARTELTVVRIGRDAVRRFRTDDWVEITDDRHELHGLPGVMRKVQTTDDVARTITLTAALPAGEFDPADPARHTRIKRWDQRGLVRDPSHNVVADVDASGGVIPVPAGPTDIVLEDGVQITFSTDPAGGAFRAADHWAFAARTADASVERLTEAPPRGIHHHYCRLAVVTFPGEVDDCRVLWPPDVGEGGGCDCSACVTPESHNGGRLTIQRAVDQVKESGGSVCLAPGLYRLEEAVRITGARSIRLHGQGWRTVLMRFTAGPVIAVERSIGVTLEDMALVSPEAGPQSPEGSSFGGQVGMGVALLNNGGVTIQRCAIVQVARSGRDAGVRARSGESRFGTLAGFTLGRGPAIALAGFQVQTRIRENALAAGVGVLGVTGGFQTGAAETPSVAPRRRFLATADLFIDDNVMLCGLRGVSLEGASLHVAETRMARNVVAGCRQGGLVIAGAVSRDAVPGSHLVVAGNTLHTGGDAIVVGTDDARISDNDVGGSGREQGGDGIVLTPGLTRAGLERCRVTGNRITAVAGDGIAIRGAVASGVVTQNTIQRTRGGGIVMDARSQAGDLIIESNQLLDIAADEDERGQALAGIRVRNAERAHVVGNSIAGVGADSRKGRSRAGIEIIASRSVRVAGNDVERVGPAEPFVGDAMGIAVAAPFERLDVVDNAVRRSRDRGKPDNARWWGILIRPTQDRVTANTIFTASRTFVLAFDDDRVTRLPRGREIVAVRGNLADAYGLSPAVEIAADGACVVSDNRCLLDSERGGPVVAVVGGAAIAGNNYLEGRGDQAVMEISVGDGPFTVVGNIGSGRILVNGSQLGAPWDDLNVVAP